MTTRLEEIEILAKGVAESYEGWPDVEGAVARNALWLCEKLREAVALLDAIQLQGMPWLPAEWENFRKRRDALRGALTRRK